MRADDQDVRLPLAGLAQQRLHHHAMANDSLDSRSLDQRPDIPLQGLLRERVVLSRIRGRNAGQIRKRLEDGQYAQLGAHQTRKALGQRHGGTSGFRQVGCHENAAQGGRIARGDQHGHF